MPTSIWLIFILVCLVAFAESFIIHRLVKNNKLNVTKNSVQWILLADRMQRTINEQLERICILEKEQKDLRKEDFDA